MFSIRLSPISYTLVRKFINWNIFKRKLSHFIQILPVLSNSYNHDTLQVRKHKDKMDSISKIEIQIMTTINMSVLNNKITKYEEIGHLISQNYCILR